MNYRWNSCLQECIKENRRVFFLLYLRIKKKLTTCWSQGKCSQHFIRKIKKDIKLSIYLVFLKLARKSVCLTVCLAREFT